MLWSFQLPRLNVDSDCEKINEFIRDNGVEVVIIDPLYLCLGVTGNATANLFETGPVLQKFAATCLNAGATPLFVHT